ncbi:response regulator transcription factor [Bacillus paramycoides]|uniref:response regulator transcription factor n=1 Tax=Bacillus paramycoides TaxID=2026194 RepID=UPI002242F6F9|nr:response regulator transcription factor [Bacillus paramycoides]MCW9134077.1 response regulator transcription factor [Bacillus paramycoides]
MAHLLIIEDDQQISELLLTALQQEYKLDFAYSGTEALFKLKEESYDLIILDLMLPGMKGESVLEAIREKSQTPVIILTALVERMKIVELLTHGANDYITKPFHLDELRARINVQLRNHINATSNQEEILSFKSLTLHTQTYELFYKKCPINLRKKEFQILELLIRHPKRIYSKQELYQLIWDTDYMEDENTINVHISNLRKKIQTVDSQNEYIETVWGIGIRLKGDSNGDH